MKNSQRNDSKKKKKKGWNKSFLFERILSKRKILKRFKAFHRKYRKIFYQQYPSFMGLKRGKEEGGEGGSSNQSGEMRKFFLSHVHDYFSSVLEFVVNNSSSENGTDLSRFVLDDTPCDVFFFFLLFIVHLSTTRY